MVLRRAGKSGNVCELLSFAAQMLQSLGLGIILCGTTPSAADEAPTTSPTPSVGIVLEMGYLSAPLSAESWINGEVASFERAHPEISVKLVRTTIPLRTKEPIETIPELPANVIGICSEPGYEVQYLVERGAIVPIDGFLEKDTSPSFGWDDFYPNVLASVQHKGKTWGVPWMACTQVLVCNMDVLALAGITSPPKTWDDVLAYAKKVRALPHEPGKPEYWGMHMTINGESLSHTYAAVALQGGPFFRDGKFDFETPGVRSAVGVFRALVMESGAIRVDQRTIAEVMSEPAELYAMHLAESQELSEVLDNKHLRVINLPTNDKPVSAAFQRYFLGVRKSTPELEAASYELVKWFARRDVSFPRALVGAPCRRDFIQRPEFKRLASQSIKGLEVIYTASEQSVEPTPPAYGRYEALLDMRSLARQVVPGQITVDEFIAMANERTNKYLLPLSGITSELNLYK